MAMAAPRPREAPVTSATLPLRSWVMPPSFREARSESRAPAVALRSSLLALRSWLFLAGAEEMVLAADVEFAAGDCGGGQHRLAHRVLGQQLVGRIGQDDVDVPPLIDRVDLAVDEDG